MAIDYVIDYPCEPKRQLGTTGILERLKGRDRAELIIQLFRKNEDMRPPDEMGFELTRSTSDGNEETQLINVQHLLDDAQDLTPLAHHCQGCPANRTGAAFGCMGFVEYPVSGKAEAWLLDQLPSIDEPLVWLLLKQGVENFQYDGQQIEVLRKRSDNYFEDKHAAIRFLGEFSLTANQVFEMIFSVGDIIPNHASVLLIFYNALERSEMEANEIMALAPATDALVERFPFLHQIMPHDDRVTVEIKDFFQALYLAWVLNVKLIVDA